MQIVIPPSAAAMANDGIIAWTSRAKTVTRAIIALRSACAELDLTTGSLTERRLKPIARFRKRLAWFIVSSSRKSET